MRNSTTTDVTPEPSAVLVGRMFSIRRLVASILVGAFVIVITAGQASAQAGDLAVAQSGVALGLQAVDEILDREAGTVVVGPGLERATEAIDSWFAQHPDSSVRGSVNSQQVHEALLAGEIPGQINNDSVESLKGLARAFENMKADSDKVKAEKAEKEKKDKKDNPGNGDNGNPGGSGSDDDRSEDAPSSDS